MRTFQNLEDTLWHYGECPLCGDYLQPDFLEFDDHDVEYVNCDHCNITWNLHHEDPTDKRDGTEPWRKYRISDIEDLEPYDDD